jgi:amino acid adenylation domain-containing protein
MTPHNRLTTVLVGGGNTLIRCAEILLNGGHEVCGVLSTDPSVRRWAKEKDLPTFEAQNDLIALSRRRPFDYLFSIVNDDILLKETLALPRRAAINYHDSLLPGYAGIHSTSWALMNQETLHGVTWHRMSKEIDAGEILKQRELRVADRDSAFTLNVKCFEAAVGSFAELVDELSEDRVSARPQDREQRSYFSRFKRPPAACVFSLKLSAQEIDAFVRGLDFGPYANPLGLPKLILGREPFVVSEMSVLSVFSDSPPSTITGLGQGSLQVATATNQLVIRKLLTVCGQPLSIEDAVAGQGLKEGDRIPELEPGFARRLTERNASICKHEAFWVKRLDEMQPIALPYAGSAAPSRSPKDVLRTTLPLPAEVTQLLESRRGAWEKSDFLLAAFGAFLARLGGVGPFDIGLRSLSLQRELAGLESFFETQVPLRLELNLAQGFSSAFEAVRDAVALAKREQTYARDAVIRYPALRARPELRGEHFWPVMAEQVDRLGDEGRPGAMLTLVIPEEAPEFRWIHDSEALSSESVTRISEQFRTFLRGIAANPDQSVADLPILTQSERRQLLVDWNDTEVDYPRDLCVHQLFEAQVERSSDAVAVVFGDESLTYGELNRRANRLARRLRAMGVGPEVLVGLCVERSLEMVVGLLGILKAGGAYVPLDPAYPKGRLSFMLEDSQAPVVVTKERFRLLVSGGAGGVVSLDGEREAIDRESGEVPESGVEPENLAYVIYTSGSTGKPKGVAISHLAIVNYTSFVGEAFALEPHDRVLQFASISFDTAAEEIFPTLARGGTLVLRTDAMLQSVATFVEKCRQWRLTVVDLPTAYWHEWVTGMTSEHCPFPESVRLVVIGGEAAIPERLSQWREAGTQRLQLLNTYGPTEATIAATFSDLSSWSAASPGLGIVPIGRPIANVRVYVLDPYRQPVPVGVAGELYIAGAGVARGYLNRPELTAERFLPDPFCFGDARMYRTGDRARFLPDGNIEFLGRLDDQVKIRGYRVEPGEVEAALARHASVREVAVIVQRDDSAGVRLVAYVVPEPNAVPSPESLRAYLRRLLPDYMIPSAFVLADAIPLTPNGKVDRTALAALFERVRGSGRVAAVAPRDDVERRLAQLWEEVLEIGPIGVQDNFFEVGGHSLAAVRLFAQIEKEFGQALPVSRLFETPTVEGLASALRGDGSRRPVSSLVAIRTEGSRSPVFLVHSGRGHVLIYLELVSFLDREQPVYGLQALLAEDGRPLHTSIPEMAAHYLSEIRSVQPSGPYLLGGSSLGGNVAFEMARQLERAGEEVALVALFDSNVPGDSSVPPPRPTGPRTLSERARFHTRKLLALPPRERLSYVQGRIRSLARRFSGRAHKLPKDRTPFMEAGELAWRRHEPGAYGGRVTLFRATLPDDRCSADGDLGWGGRCTGGVEIVDVSGGHITMFAHPHVRGLAERLNGCLERAGAQTPEALTTNPLGFWRYEP